MTDLTWTRALAMWCEAMQYDTALFSAARWKQEGQDFARFCSSEQAFSAVLERYLADPWVQRTRPMPSHLAKHFPRYAEAHAPETEEDRALAARQRREAIQDAKITIDMSDDPRAVAAAKRRLAELEAG